MLNDRAQKTPPLEAGLSISDLTPSVEAPASDTVTGGGGAVLNGASTLSSSVSGTLGMSGTSQAGGRLGSVGQNA